VLTVASRGGHVADAGPAYQFTFENYTQWPEFYSAGQDIQSYIKRVAEKYGTYQYLKLQHEVVGASWQDHEAKWSVQVKDVTSGTTFTDSCDFLVVSTGILNAWKWPDIPGLMDFKGKLMHTADYDTSYDLKDKKVALIGAGSTGIQVLPTIQPVVRRLDHYMRSKTWIASGGFAGAEALKRNPAGGNCKSTPFLLDPVIFGNGRAH
jgi:cation diffusion facilitator CzcD-associated flavoprotein CzcO